MDPIARNIRRSLNASRTIVWRIRRIFTSPDLAWSLQFHVFRRHKAFGREKRARTYEHEEKKKILREDSAR